MARRRAPSPIGLSMLDLISNSLAAVIILFIILAAMRVPSIPPERVKGTLMVRMELLGDGSNTGDTARSEPWVFAPMDMPSQPSTKKPHKRLYGNTGVRSMNGDSSFYGKWCNCDSLSSPQGAKPLFSPCAMAYRGVSEPNVHYMVFKNPIKDLWQFGLIYVENTALVDHEVKDSIGIRYWLMLDDYPENLNNDAKDTVVAPTDWSGWQVDVGKLADKLQLVGPQ